MKRFQANMTELQSSMQASSALMQQFNVLSAIPTPFLPPPAAQVAAQQAAQLAAQQATELAAQQAAQVAAQQQAAPQNTPVISTVTMTNTGNPFMNMDLSPPDGYPLATSKN